MPPEAVGGLRQDVGDGKEVFRVDCTVRPARAGDAGAVGLVHARAWQAAYADVVPAAVLRSLAPDDLADRWLAATVRPPSPRHRVLVAFEQDEVVGFAATAPAGDPDLDPMLDGELISLLVDPGAAGRGHGSRLLAAAVDHLRGDGFRHGITWVLATDDVVRTFLAGAGWAPDGAHRELETGQASGTDGRLHQVRLHTSLEEGS